MTPSIITTVLIAPLQATVPKATSIPMSQMAIKPSLPLMTIGWILPLVKTPQKVLPLMTLLTTPRMPRPMMIQIRQTPLKLPFMTKSLMMKPLSIIQTSLLLQTLNRLLSRIPQFRRYRRPNQVQTTIHILIAYGCYCFHLYLFANKFILF